jgi:hypothetical protein
MTKCPQCGYEEVVTPKDIHTIMNHYITTNGKRQAFFNRRESTFVTGDKESPVTWILKVDYDKAKEAKEAKEAASKITPKITPTT